MVSTDAWNPNQYELFQEERSQPFYDLLSLVEPRAAMRVVDLGCGTGELTRHAHTQLNAAHTLGIDSSAAMLEKSRDLQIAGLHFEQVPIEVFAPPQPYDLVLSNAALQWLPDHTALLAHVASWVAPGGQLAIQMPANHDHVSHTTAREVAAETQFKSMWKSPPRPTSVLAPELYAQMLNELGFQKQHVRLQIYAHELPTRAHVVQWVRGTLLTSYQKDVTAEQYDAFVARYTEALLPRLGERDPYFYAFKRLLIWASR